jgi:hypothetical protein
MEGGKSLSGVLQIAGPHSGLTAEQPSLWMKKSKQLLHPGLHWKLIEKR